MTRRPPNSGNAIDKSLFPGAGVLSFLTENLCLAVTSSKRITSGLAQGSQHSSAKASYFRPIKQRRLQTSMPVIM